MTDPILAHKSAQNVQRQNLAFLGLAGDPMGIFSVQVGLRDFCYGALLGTSLFSLFS